MEVPWVFVIAIVLGWLGLSMIIALLCGVFFAGARHKERALGARRGQTFFKAWKHGTLSAPRRSRFWQIRRKIGPDAAKRAS